MWGIASAASYIIQTVARATIEEIPIEQESPVKPESTKRNSGEARGTGEEIAPQRFKRESSRSV